MTKFGTIKPVVRGLLPAPVYERLASSWRKYTLYPSNLRTWLRHGRPDRLIYFGNAPGDDLLCTAVLRELRDRGVKKLWMMSRHSDLFKGNPDVRLVVSVGSNSQNLSFVQENIQYAGKRFQSLVYSHYDPGKDRAEPTNRHVIAELCANAGVTGKIALRPYFHLTEEEIASGQWAAGMIAIQSSNLAARYAMRNKEWVPGRYQEAVNALRGRHQVLQLGAATDPLLDGIRDLRGRTSFREAAAILFHARLYVGGEGFLMHLARAVECPSVIILGGRTAPWQFGYSCNENLYSPIPCAPCWYWNNCDHNRICMENITSEMALQAINRQLSKPRGPLEIDYATI